ncbi:MAG: hypothetical protein IJ681_03335 [Bacteroidales bacterium]|nr:hypothetical protein [Bacteroidales bacterium]
MILALHVNFVCIGSVGGGEISVDRSAASLRVFLEFVCIVAVNVFVLISGYFGINAKAKGLSNFLYQIIFFYGATYLFFLLIGKSSLSYEGITSVFFLQKGGWFIKSYLCLYILSPILNTFIKNSQEKQIRNILFAFFLFQAIYGWVFSNSTSYFANGYSVVSFIGLYLLARYVRLYGEKIKLFTLKRKYDIILFFLICVAETILYIMFCIYDISFLNIFTAYSSIFIILSALHLFLFFSKLKFESETINIIAKSSFAAYLFHSSYCILPIYKRIGYYIYCNYSSLYCILLMLVFILITYILSIIMDRVRLFTWKSVERKFFN